MEKSYTRRIIAFVIMFLSIACVSNVNASKMARISLSELLKSAYIVAVVTVEKSTLTNKIQTQLHTTIPLQLIEHRARIEELIKGNSKIKSLSFLNTKGLIVGSRYVVFLRQGKDSNNHVMLNGYGALKISYTSMNQKVVAATRVAKTYIDLPNTIKYELGKTTKDEAAVFVWGELDNIVKYMKKALN